MVNFADKKFIKFYLGSKEIQSHIDAVHACPPKPDEFTGNIVEGVVEKIDCSGIIAIVSRTKVDLNRPRNNNNEEAIDEYRQTIGEILENLDNPNENGQLLKPYLHLAIHGMRDRLNNDIEIGTLHGETCSPEVKNWFVKEIKKYTKIFQWRVLIDEIFPGNPSKSVHRCGDKQSDFDYSGYGNNFNTFQIEISRTLRKNHRNELINMFSDIIIQFNEKFK